jgi:hypothetical protein
MAYITWLPRHGQLVEDADDQRPGTSGSASKRVCDAPARRGACAVGGVELRVPFVGVGYALVDDEAGRTGQGDRLLGR